MRCLTGHRFIPAYAGNSAADQSKNDLPPVHPRLRGELFPDGLINDPLIGSSPLTRGTRQARHWLRYPSRFIPAYAGNSSAAVPSLISFPVHPRLRGELADEKVDDTLLDRFIPAYAGNSRTA